MPVFIQNFLQNRSFRVRMGEVFSDEKEQEMIGPQSSVLSVTQFIIKINDIVKNINSRTNYFGYGCLSDLLQSNKHEPHRKATSNMP